jgi:predicted DNA-binding protein YlxM (UPF0122 family)
MPYKFETDKLKIPKTKDKRVKLTDGQKKIIRDMYKSGEYSQRMLAREFNVSRRTIQFTIDPKKREYNYQKRVENGGSKQYYDKDKNNEYMKSHRDHKKELYKNGELK